MRRLVLAVTVALAACGDDQPSARDTRVEQARAAALAAGLDDDVADLLGDAAGGVEATYRVTYDVDGATVVVTQRPPDRRVDVTAADGTVDATISVDGRTHACTDPAGDEPMRCERFGAPSPSGVLDADAVESFATAMGQAVERYDFVVDDRELAGSGARCLVTSLRPGVEAAGPLGETATLCVAPSGALLLVERPVGTLRATAYTTDVPDDAFALPAGTG